MKATAIALLLVSAYWLIKGSEIFHEDLTKSAEFIALGLILLPLAKYLWAKDIGGRGSFGNNFGVKKKGK
jgi:hypothetical protein